MPFASCTFILSLYNVTDARSRSTHAQPHDEDTDGCTEGSQRRAHTRFFLLAREIIAYLLRVRDLAFHSTLSGLLENEPTVPAEQAHTTRAFSKHCLLRPLVRYSKG